jgi:hypothetical protein
MIAARTNEIFMRTMMTRLGDAAQSLPALLQLHIEMAEGRELAGELGVAGHLYVSARRKVAAAEEVGS